MVNFMASEMAASRSVALIGSGLIGRGWMILFANAGYEVRVYDVSDEARTAAADAALANLQLLETEGMIDSAQALLQRIRFCASMAEAVIGAEYVQENVHEVCETKRSVFIQLGRLAARDTVLASSCSTIPPEQFLADVAHRERCLIAHPFSPPHLIPLVELVPTRWTSEHALQRTRELMVSLGQTPVLITKPVVGFAVNRLQAAVINEALSLVDEGVIAPADLDLCMSQGLGLRWAFLGPFETMELNAPKGFMDYATKFGAVYRSILDTMRVDRPWSARAIGAVESWRRTELPGEADVVRRRLWRDHNLMKLAKLFRGPKIGSRRP
jgi:3-hydroxyacyl-CoA dehydrogenase